MSTDRTTYEPRTCPVHVGVPLRRVGPLYYCPVATPADEAEWQRRAVVHRAAELAARLRWVVDVCEIAVGGPVADAR